MTSEMYNNYFHLVHSFCVIFWLGLGTAGGLDLVWLGLGLMHLWPR